MDTFVAGMTVNERLSHFGLFDAFDAAIHERDIAAIASVLRQAELTQTQALETAKAVLAQAR